MSELQMRKNSQETFGSLKRLKNKRGRAERTGNNTETEPDKTITITTKRSNVTGGSFVAGRCRISPSISFLNSCR